MSDRPRVTAVLPAYNAAPFISRTLAGLAAQSWDDLEILIGDDGSTDETPGILRDWAEARANVRLALRETNLGWTANINDLVRRARGELVFIMPHDDEIAPGYVARLVDALDRNPRATLAFSDMTWARADGGRILRFDRLTGVRDPALRALIMALRPEGWFVPFRGLFRAEAFRASGGLRTTPGLGEFAADFRWLFAMSLQGEWVRAPEALYRKNWESGSVSNTVLGGEDAGRALHRAAIEDIRASGLPRVRKRAVLAALHALAPVRTARRRMLRLLGR